MKWRDIVREMKKANLEIANAGLAGFFEVGFEEGVFIGSNPERLRAATDDELIAVMTLATKLKKQFEAKNIACRL